MIGDTSSMQESRSTKILNSFGAEHNPNGRNVELLVNDGQVGKFIQTKGTLDFNFCQQCAWACCINSNLYDIKNLLI